MQYLKFLLQITVIEYRFERKKQNVLTYVSQVWNLLNLSIRLEDNTSVVQSTYASTLTTESAIYSRGSCLSVNYFYEAIEISTVTGAYYAFWSNSTLDMYGYIYKNTFNPFNPSINLLSQDDNECFNMQFLLRVQLQANTTYVLVATTYRPNRMGNFSIIISGPAKVTLNRISEYIYYSLNTQSGSENREHAFNFHFHPKPVAIFRNSIFVQNSILERDFLIIWYQTISILSTKTCLMEYVHSKLK